MSTRLLLAYDDSLSPETTTQLRDLSTTLATMLGEVVLLAGLTPELLDDLRAWVLLKTEGTGLDGVEPKIAAAPTMSSAPFEYRDDGKPDWGAMWQSFCELALYGGPPHRGPDDPVLAPANNPGAPAATSDAIAEIRRGVWETTGLYSEPATPGWLAVTCHDRRMAAWMCAAIILENVDARCEDEILFVPASADFELKNEVKSVITVVAKVNHYWQAHITEQNALASQVAVTAPATQP